MTIQEIVQQALRDGCLTPTMEREVEYLCQSATKLSLEEYEAIDRLMGALLAGEIEPRERQQFINVMEELVMSAAIRRVAEIEATSELRLEVGDIAAYALNRLPPLYATTEKGANCQRQRAKEELQDLIGQRVEEGIHRYLNRPDNPGEPLRQKVQPDFLEQITVLLKSYAPSDETSRLS